MAALDSEVKVTFGAELDVAFNKILNDIDRGFRDVEKSGKKSADEINSKYASLSTSLEKFSKSLTIADQKMGKFGTTGNIEDLGAALKKSQTAIKDYEKILEDLRETRDFVFDNGGTRESLDLIDEKIRAISDSLEIYKRDIDNLSADYINELAEAYNDLSDESEKAEEKTNAINAIMENLGVSAEEAAEKFGGAASKIADVAKAFATGGIKAAAAKVAMMALSAVATATVGAIVKGVTKVINAIKEEIKYRKSLRDYVQQANTDAIKEIAELNRLNDALNRAGKNTAEYANVKDEIVKKFGKYDSSLAQEITRVGDLSESYDRLANAILQTSLARQRDKIASEQVDNYSKSTARQFQKLREKAIKEFGAEEGQRIYGEAFTQLNSETFNGILEGDARQLEFISARLITNIAKTKRKLEKRIKETFGVYGTGSNDTNTDYTNANNEFGAIRSAQEQLRKIDEEETRMFREQSQNAIDAMADGAAKQRAQAKLDYDRQIDQLKSQQEGLKEQYVQMAKAEWIKKGGLPNQFSDEMAFSQLNGALSGETNGPLSPWLQSYVKAVNANKEMQEQQKKVLDKMLSDISFQESQSNAENYGNTGQQRQAIIDRFDRDIKSLDERYRAAAEKKKEYEIALFDYNAVKDTGNLEAERKALEKMLDAEIATLDRTKKEAAIKRKELTLAEFGAETIEKYGTAEQRKKLLEDTLAAEVKVIDEKYLEVKEAMDKLARAEFDEEAISQYGTRSERRSARLSTLMAEADVFRAKNGVVRGSAKDKKITADVEFKIAQWDWEQVMDFGGFEEKLKALNARWDAYIKTLDSGQRAGALKQKQKEIAELEMQSSRVYKQIFADTDGMGKEMINNVIQLAEAQLKRLIDTGNTSADVLNNLRDRIDTLKQSRDQLDFKGWGGTVQGLLQSRNSRNDLMSRRESLIAERNALTRPTLTGDAKADSLAIQQYQERYASLSEAIKKADGGIKNLTADMKKEAAMLAASALGDTLGKVGDAMQQIASVSGDDSLAEAGEALSGIGGMVSGIANGFATGGLIGGIAAAVTSLADATIQAITSVAIADAEYSKFLKNFAEQIELLKIRVNSDDYKNAFGANSLAEAQAQWNASLGALEKYKNAVSELRGMTVKTHDYSWWAELWGKSDQYANLSSFDIFNTEGLDIDKARAFLETASFLTDEQRQQIENAIALKEAYDEARQAVNDYVSSLTGSTVSTLADEMLDNFLQTGSAIVDMTDNMSDFGRAMAKSAIESKLLGKVFNEEAEANLAELIATGNTEGAISMYNSLLEAANAMAPEIEAFLKGINYEELAGAADRANQSGGFVSMSQQSADELNGRFTGLQISATNIDETTRAIKEQNDAMFLRSGEVLLELMGIHSDTSDLRNSVGELRSTCGEIQSGVNKIVRDGVRLN